MNFLRKYQVHILGGLLAFFVIYIALGFGTSFFVKGSPNDTVVEVDGEKIPLHTYASHYYRSLDQTKPLDKAGLEQKRDETIRDLVQFIVFKREIKRYGIQVPDQQVAVSLTQIPAFQTQDKRFSPQQYMQVLQSQLKTSPKEFEEEQRMSLGFFKLRWLIQSTIKVTDKEMDLSGQYAEFARAHTVEEVDHKKRTRPPAEIHELFRKQLWDEKTLYSFNQWLTSVGQKLRVKTHFDVLEGGSVR